MQFLFTFGTVPVALAILASRRFRLEPSRRGIFFALTNGFISAIGILAMMAAFRSGGNTAVIAVLTSLYPMISVILALFILRERLTKLQVIGLFLAGAAIVIFSL